MSHLTRPCAQGEGKPKGSIATCPKDIDAILHHVWDPITDGNCSNPLQQVNAYVSKYKRHIVKADEFFLGDITVEEFKAQCQADLKSAPGLDGWSAEDLELLSDQAYQVLVDMLNCIERGARWPKAMLHASQTLAWLDPAMG